MDDKKLRFLFRPAETNDPETEACISFWRGLLSKTIDDIFDYTPKHRSSYYNLLNSLKFFFSDDIEYKRHYELVCDYGFVNAENLQKYIRTLVIQKGLHNVIRNPEIHSLASL